MRLTQRIKAFAHLGNFLKQFREDCIDKQNDVLHNERFFEGFKQLLHQAEIHNAWFTQKNIGFACEQWASLLTIEKLENWTNNYDLDLNSPKTVAIIMAGNIPMVGFHDFLSVLLSGHSVILKQSSNDKLLLPFLTKYLIAVESCFENKIFFTQERLNNFDAVIATGSTNTARYFDYYFGKHPNIIRKNRNSVAILKGDETPEQLRSLGEDIFRYFGLGCRNVSKLFVPQGYNFDLFFNAIYEWKDVIEKNKYANNYDYNKAVYLMSLFDILENGFLMLKEDTSYGSPIATIFYEYYENEETLTKKLESDSSSIQCIVSDSFGSVSIPFGETQKPALMDYADGIDTLTFLSKL